MLNALDILCLRSMVSMRRLLKVFLTPHPSHVFTNIAKLIHFQSKTIFFFQDIAGRY